MISYCAVQRYTIPLHATPCHVMLCCVVQVHTMKRVVVCALVCSIGMQNEQERREEETGIQIEENREREVQGCYTVSHHFRDLHIKGKERREGVEGRIDISTDNQNDQRNRLLYFTSLTSLHSSICFSPLY